MQPADQPTLNGATGRIEDLERQLGAMKQELDAVKSHVESLREKCSEMNKALLMLCCPKEWYSEEIDEKEFDEALAHAHESPTLQELIDSLAKDIGETNARLL